MPRQTPRQATAKFFFALAHQRRLKIIETLQGHPKGITYDALGQATGIPEGSLTHHLRILGEADVIGRKIKDRFTYYRLNTDAVRAILPTAHLKQAA